MSGSPTSRMPSTTIHSWVASHWRVWRSDAHSPIFSRGLGQKTSVLPTSGHPSGSELRATLKGRDVMATFRIMAIALAVVGSAVLAPALARAQGCDSPYPWLCKPVPSIDPPETAEPNKQPAAKPLPIAARDAGVKRSAKTAHAAQPRKRSARKAASRRWALRARHAKVVAARAAAETAEVKSSRSPRPPSAETGRVERPPAEPAPAADGATGPTTGFTAMWTE